MENSVAPPSRWELYRVLAEPVRLRLLALAAEEELAVGELAVLLAESQPNVSRHLTLLRQAGLVMLRREGTRGLVRISEAADADPVVADALQSGRSLCESDGSLQRIGDVLRDRDQVAREFFAQASGDRERERDRERAEKPDAVAAYLTAIAHLLPNRRLAVDAGTGDGALLEVLAPAFEQVVAVDRSAVQLERAEARIARRGFSNVRLLKAELSAAELREHVGDGADVVFASRLLHHAPRPGDLVRLLTRLARPPVASDAPHALGSAATRSCTTSTSLESLGGAVVVVDYAAHDDESMRSEADLWLGFDPSALRVWAHDAGLGQVHIAPIPAPWCGSGKDAHLPWQFMVARRIQTRLDTQPPKPKERRR